MLSSKVSKLFALNMMTLVLIVGLASSSGADVVREQSSRVEYAPVEPATDQFDVFDKLVGSPSANQEESQKKDISPPSTTSDAPATSPVCTCQDNGETSSRQASDETVSKSKASAKRIAKKYKVITISMPEDDQTDADAVIETKVEEQPEPQVAEQQEKAQKKDEGVEVIEVAEPEDEEAAGELQEEDKAQVSKSKGKDSKGKSKDIKGNKKSENNKRSKREAENQKRSKRDSKEGKRSSSKGNYKKSKRDSYKGRKDK